MLRVKLYVLLVGVLLSASCIVRAPRFTRVDKVSDLKLGLTPEEVTNTLGTIPYYPVSMNDSEFTVLYKYRVTDRTTLPFLLKENNGKEVRGKYVNLMVTYNKHRHVKKYVSCNDCDVTDVQQKKIDINKVVTFLTVTLPVVLVFLGIRFGSQIK